VKTLEPGRECERSALVSEPLCRRQERGPGEFSSATKWIRESASFSHYAAVDCRVGVQSSSDTPRTPAAPRKDSIGLVLGLYAKPGIIGSFGCDGSVGRVQ
jgi:hypothetical protein